VALVVFGFLAFDLGQRVQQTGPFGDRKGSDWFRRDIHRKSKERARASLILGDGAAPSGCSSKGR